jgi:hypothetical protein
MNELTDVMAAHDANQHPLFTYLRVHALDDEAWEIFATQYYYVVSTAPLYFALLRGRLPLTEQEIFDHLIETSAPACHLVPCGFFPVTEGIADVLDELAPLPEVEAFVQVHTGGMKYQPLPMALGMCYAHCQEPSWSELMDQIIAPYLARLDLLRVGLITALDVRALLWDGIYAAITHTPF